MEGRLVCWTHPPSMEIQEKSLKNRFNNVWKRPKASLWPVTRASYAALHYLLQLLVVPSPGIVKRAFKSQFMKWKCQRIDIWLFLTVEMCFYEGCRVQANQVFCSKSSSNNLFAIFSFICHIDNFHLFEQ